MKTLTLDPSEIKTTGGRKKSGPEYLNEVNEAVKDGQIHALPVESLKDGQRHARYLRRDAAEVGVALRIRTFEHPEHGWVVSYVVKPETDEA